jgi:hypothetical protein
MTIETDPLEPLMRAAVFTDSPDPKEIKELKARAFNEGSDCRLRGGHIRDNPYLKEGKYSPLWEEWRHGYFDVERFWGKGALNKNRSAYKWPVKPLPEVNPLLNIGEN